MIHNTHCEVVKLLIHHQVYLHQFFPKGRDIVILEKKKINLQFALEGKYCSMIVKRVPTRLKRFSGQSLFYLSFSRDQWQSTIIQVALHFEHQSLKSCVVFHVQLSFFILTSFLLFFAGLSLFHIDTNDYIFMCVTLNLLDLTPYKLCLLFAFWHASAPTNKTVSNDLLQCYWVTAFRGVEWKYIYVNKHQHPKKFQVTFSGRVFWLEV